MNLRIDTILFPIDGLDTEPDFPDRLIISGDRLEWGINYLIGKSPLGSSLIRSTSTGALKVADTGAGLEAYDVEVGTTVDAYAVGQTYTSTSGWNEASILVEGNDVTAAFASAAGTYGDDWSLAVGLHRIPMTFWAVKFKSRVGGFEGNFEFRGMT